MFCRIKKNVNMFYRINANVNIFMTLLNYMFFHDFRSDTSRHYSFSTYPEFSEKLTPLTP